MTNLITEGTTYTVEPGDTLVSIAQKFYGNSSEFAWEYIYRHNIDTIGPDPTRIEPGMVIKIEVPLRTPTNT